MSTFLHRFDVEEGPGPRLAVKAMVDVAGAVTSLGCEALSQRPPASEDATVVTTMRANGARVVGVVNCEEWGLGATGRNDWSGTPVNPRYPDHVPGGSSSGSATAVAAGEADLALGTDAGGSCRIPAACCGVAGLKTTPGRLPTAGTHLYALNIDSVGPMAADVDGLVSGMRLIEPGFEPITQEHWRVGRFRAPDVNPAIEDAIDGALRDAGVDVVEVTLDGWEAAYRAATTMIMVAATQASRHLLGRDGLGQWAADRIQIGTSVGPERMRDAERGRTRFRAELEDVLTQVDVLALPTVAVPIPHLEDDRLTADLDLSRLTLPFNLAGSAAVALPLPGEGATPPPSLQLVGLPFDEERVLGAALHVAAAVRRP